MEQINRDFMTLREASKIVGCTPEHLNLMVRRKKLEAKKIGRNWCTTREWLSLYLEQKKKNRKRNHKGDEEKREINITPLMNSSKETGNQFDNCQEENKTNLEKESVSKIDLRVETALDNRFIKKVEKIEVEKEKSKINILSLAQALFDRNKIKKIIQVASLVFAVFIVFFASPALRQKMTNEEDLQKLFDDINEVSFFDEREGIVKGEETEDNLEVTTDRVAHASENYKIKQIRFGGDVIVTADEDVKLEIQNLRSESFLTKKQDEAKMIITWSTSKPAISEIEYAKNNGQETRKLKESGYGYHHGVVVPGLELDQAYVYQVRVKDKWGNAVSSGNYAVYSGKKAVSIVELIARELEKMFGWAKRY